MNIKCRKDAGTGNKLTFYIDGVRVENESKIKVAFDYMKAQIQALADELEEAQTTIDQQESMLKLADIRINSLLAKQS
jgi:hypothetical protein